MRAIAWILLAVAILANVAGYTANLYERFWWFDRVLHAGTILTMTLWLAVFVFLRALNQVRSGWLPRFLLIASVGIAVGALWEVVEWGLDDLISGNVIKGKNDTVLDIIMDTAGAGVAAALALWGSPDSSEPSLNDF